MLILTIRGPRLYWAIEELKRSIEILSPPLSLEESRAGWDSTTQQLMVDGYKKVLHDIEMGVTDQRHYKSWIRGIDHVTKEGLAARSGSTRGDDASLDLYQAQFTLDTLYTVREALRAIAPPPTDISNSVQSIIDKLEHGEYLVTEDEEMLNSALDISGKDEALGQAIDRDVMVEASRSVALVLQNDELRRRHIR